jgi:hypothetical protein
MNPLAMKGIYRRKKPFVLLALLFGLTAIFVVTTNHPTVDYNTEVKPILNRSCISCHGGVKKQGGFGLLFREDALVKLKSGRYGIVPGDAGSSEMIRRLSLTDPEERMPYQHEALSNSGNQNTNPVG